MAQYTNAALQTVADNQNVLFTDTPVGGNKCIRHRDGSGIATLKAGNAPCRALYIAKFTGNIGIPTGGTVAPISLAISIDGEPLGEATMISTPAAVGTLQNVSAVVIIKVFQSCCTSVTVRNVSGQEINVQNASLVLNRIA